MGFVAPIRINGHLTFERAKTQSERPPPRSLFIECKGFLIGMFFAVINWPWVAPFLSGAADDEQGGQLGNTSMKSKPTGCVIPHERCQNRSQVAGVSERFLVFFDGKVAMHF